MYLDKRNVAYDLSLFETPQQRKDNILNLPQKKIKAHSKRNFSLKLAVSLMAFCMISLTIVGVLIYNQVQLTELTANINSASKKLTENEGIYTQLQVKKDSTLSLSVVEDCAKNKLGMQKIDPSQIEYVSLSNADRATVKTNGSFLSSVL